MPVVVPEEPDPVPPAKPALVPVVVDVLELVPLVAVVDCPLEPEDDALLLEPLEDDDALPSVVDEVGAPLELALAVVAADVDAVGAGMHPPD